MGEFLVQSTAAKAAGLPSIIIETKRAATNFFMLISFL
jgi:hypothetical protein